MSTSCGHQDESTFFRVPTHFLKQFSKFKSFNTITYLHFCKILFMEHNAINTCKTVISAIEQNLNTKMAEI